MEVSPIIQSIAVFRCSSLSFQWLQEKAEESELLLINVPWATALSSDSSEKEKRNKNKWRTLCAFYIWGWVYACEGKQQFKCSCSLSFGVNLWTVMWRRSRGVQLGTNTTRCWFQLFTRFTKDTKLISKINWCVLFSWNERCVKVKKKKKCKITFD